MTIPEAYEAITYRGDAVQPNAGEHDIRKLCAEVVSRLPEEVREWLLHETSHFFIAGHGQHGEMIELCFSPDEVREGLIWLRVIFLSEQLMKLDKDEALWTIAHEIAHSRLQHEGGSFYEECAADRLANEWGFIEPSDRAEIRMKHHD